MESVNGELILAVGAAAGCLAYVLLRRCGPDIPRPAGWSAQKDNAPLAELRVTLEDGKGHCIQLRRISWEQRSEVAHLLSRAHAFTAPWVRIFESFSPPSIGAFEYAYTLEEQASATPVSFADRDRCKKREAALAWTFERNLSLFPSNHDLYVAVDAGTGEVVGCVALVRSSSYSLASKIRVGLLNFPFVWGLQAFIRLLRLGDAFDGIEARRTRGLDPDHLRVERVAVDQRFQGHGVGRFLLREMQRLLDERGVPGFLTTQNERTVRWYETLGWRLLPGSPEWLEHESSFPFRNWSMWRECQSQPPMLTKLSHAAQSADVCVEQRLSDSAQSASDADGTYRRLWATSVTFARYLWMHPELVRGKRVVELGAGSGAIGLVCAALGASHVCITDVPGALPLIDSNVQRNPRLASGSISIAPCVWGHRSQIHEIVAKSGAFDVVVACEVIYKQEWPVLAALLDTMDSLLAHGPGRPAILLAYKRRSSVLLEDAGFFGPAAERFRVEHCSLRPYEEQANEDGAGGGAQACDDGRLALYTFTRGVFVRERASEQRPQTDVQEVPPNDESIEAVVSRAGLAHLTGVLNDAAVSELAQAALDDRPALLARLRAAGVERLADRQKLANELTRCGRRLGARVCRST